MADVALDTEDSELDLPSRSLDIVQKSRKRRVMRFH